MSNEARLNIVPKLTWGCISFSDVALEQIENLPEEEQKKLAAGIVRAYRKVLNFFYEIHFSTFLHVETAKTLSTIASEITTFEIDGYAVRVSICSNNFDWHVSSIGLPGSLRSYEIRNI